MLDPIRFPDEHSAAELVTSVRDVRYTQLVSFVAATIVIYDYVVCLEREVELIWKKRWSVIKLAFLWHRYFGILCVLFQVYALNSTVVNDEKFCQFWFYWETWGYSAVLFTSEAVLLLWIYVIYNKSRWIIVVMGSCYVAQVAGAVIILTISFETFEAKADGIPGVEYCVVTGIGYPFPLLWVPILGYDAILLALFIYRGCAGASSTSSWPWAYRYDGLLDMIYRHSLLNFLAIFGSYLACATIWLTCDLGLYQIPVSFALSLSITNCTRLLLNIRRAYYCSTSDLTFYHVGDLPASSIDVPTPTLPIILLDSPFYQDVPNSPQSPASGSSLSHLSGSTLREPSVTPPRTPRKARPSSVSTLFGTIGHGHGSACEQDPETEWVCSCADAPASTLHSEDGAHCAALAQQRDGGAAAHDRGRPRYLSAEGSAQWWQQFEMSEMLQERGCGELVSVRESVVGEAV